MRWAGRGGEIVDRKLECICVALAGCCSGLALFVMCGSAVLVKRRADWLCERGESIVHSIESHEITYTGNKELRGKSLHS